MKKIQIQRDGDLTAEDYLLAASDCADDRRGENFPVSVDILRLAECRRRKIIITSYG
jgi:hypothetical protein